MLNLKQLRQKSAGQLDPLDFDLLLSAALKKPREFLYIHPEQKITAGQLNNFKKLLARRKRGEPLAYLLGHKEFFGLDFKVNKNVLIPRPETEIMVEAAARQISNINPEYSGQISNKIQNQNNKIILVDVGTGSGCIPIALSKVLNIKNIKIFATDISAKALKVAQYNAKKHGVKIIFKKGHLLKPILSTMKQFNNLTMIITANLPYGWKAWKNNTSAEAKGLKFEPAIALFTDKNGLQLYEELLKQISQINIQYLISNIFIYLEIDPRQTKLIKPLIKKYLPVAKVEIKKDLGSRDRLVIIKN